MKKKLNSILLIDDHEPTNYLNKMGIDELQCSKEVKTALSGYEALNYLATAGKSKTNRLPQPDLIFLDLNMPAMNGWEFLEEYRRLNSRQEKMAVLIMLTTSLNPDDKKMIKRYTEIAGIRHKPLTKAMMKEILEKYF